MRGLELLRQHGFRLNVLSVLTTDNIDIPEEMFRFFLGHNLRRVAFNVEEIEGPNLQSSLLAGTAALPMRGPATARSCGPSTGSTASRASHSRYGSSRAWRGLIRAWRADPTCAPDAPERRLGGILTVARNGAVSSWSPELASVGDLTLGNIGEVESIDELLESDRARTVQAEIDRGIAMCRTECEFSGVCGGGHGQQVLRAGTFAATETLKCALHTKSS
jgi:uncharacterized protein